MLVALSLASAISHLSSTRFPSPRTRDPLNEAKPTWFARAGALPTLTTPGLLQTPWSCKDRVWTTIFEERGDFVPVIFFNTWPRKWTSRLVSNVPNCRGRYVRLMSMDWFGSRRPLQGLGWKWALGLVENVIGNRWEWFVILHKASTWSPTLHSPNTTLGSGDMVTSTGAAVAETAISSLQPESSKYQISWYWQH